MRKYFQKWANINFGNDDLGGTYGNISKNGLKSGLGLDLFFKVELFFEPDKL